MKLQVIVCALIKHHDKVLLVRRSVDTSGKYQLPMVSLENGEQPEDAARRCVREQAGWDVDAAQLTSATTLEGGNDRQNVCILYTVAASNVDNKIQLSEQYDHYKWRHITDISVEEITTDTFTILRLRRQAVAPLVLPVGKRSGLGGYIVYSDGGSRGNPGPSAAGYIVMNESEEIVARGGQFLGVTTNNQAEYHGVLLGLQKAYELGAKSVDFRIDSLLVVNQMNGMYRIKNRELWPIHERIKKLINQFDAVKFSHVRREFNQLADGVVNEILDKEEADTGRTAVL